MRWMAVFQKGVVEQIRDYWILIMIVVMAPLFIFIYFLMSETEESTIEVVVANLDTGLMDGTKRVNLGDSLVTFHLQDAKAPGLPMLQVGTASDRDAAMEEVRNRRSDVGLVIPPGFTNQLMDSGDKSGTLPEVELIGDLTHMEYMVGAIWTEELVTRFVMEQVALSWPITWLETPVGYSGIRTEFDYYVPGLIILSIIMIIFSASAAIVREPETRTLERLKISRLTSFEFLAGTSLVQIIIALLSVLCALMTAILLDYTMVPGSFGFILLIGFLTTLSMISFSLLVAAMCRSIKEVAIIGTFPLFLLMFFTGAAFPISGGVLFTLGEFEVTLNGILSPTHAVEAMNKVLIRGLPIRETLPEMTALLVLTILYFALGTWAFRSRHMRAARS